MTRDEAIERLSDIRADYSCFDDDERLKYHALSMAIQALHEPEIVQCRDCKWNETPECPMAETTVEEVAGVMETGVGECYNVPDDYCSYGVPKGGDTP